MRVRIKPDTALSGSVSVPGDKSIAHRWLILATTAQGRCRITGLPPSLDVRSTASCLSTLSPKAQPGLDAWSREVSAEAESHGSTWNTSRSHTLGPALEVEGEGRQGLRQAPDALDCGNSGTSMRLLAGVVASCSFATALTGDASLSARPMERVAEPLRAMGARVKTSGGHAPIHITGGPLTGIRYSTPVPTAQVKSAVLLAGIAAEGETTFIEPARTRDHTERALAALGAPVTLSDRGVTVSRFQHAGFAGDLPGDPSSAAFLIAAAALTGGEIEISGVGLNPTRLRFLAILERMGVRSEIAVDREVLGEPVGTIRADAPSGLIATIVGSDELPLVVDEVPVLAMTAVHARGESRFEGAAELRVKESDRLRALAEGIRSLGGEAADEGDALVVAGPGLSGGTAEAGGDHRLAMAFAVASLAASAPCEIGGLDSAEVSFPGFVRTLLALGAVMDPVT